ncbi:MAG: hypothetical protein CMO80_14555 [Verrucomicrobiales bacterium]|nr:hypothetical protein [Verrucomicrobiales bacterium]
MVLRFYNSICNSNRAFDSPIRNNPKRHRCDSMMDSSTRRIFTNRNWNKLHVANGAQLRLACDNPRTH